MPKAVRDRLFITVFGTETKAGRLFDVVVLWIIVASVLDVMLESIPALGLFYPYFFRTTEWTFTILFSMEYILRLWVSPKPLRYIFSFWGLVDLVAVLPTYIGLFYTGYESLLIIRTLRLLRVFRILKLTRYMRESQVLFTALREASYKIGVFLASVLAVVVVMGTLLYVVEEGNQGFQSIPSSIYWAIVTVTTVGYGDIVPQTVSGKLIASIIMLTGYSIIAVPTGIVTVELGKTTGKNPDKRCSNCGHISHFKDQFCSHCGTKFDDEHTQEPFYH